MRRLLLHSSTRHLPTYLHRSRSSSCAARDQGAWFCHIYAVWHKIASRITYECDDSLLQLRNIDLRKILAMGQSLRAADAFWRVQRDARRARESRKRKAAESAE